MTTHQIIHGNCADVLPDVGVKANLILTSPPYDNLRTYGGHGFDFERMADACVGALAEGGVLVWVVADATIDGSETGTSFRQALGFMERGLKLHDTMIYQCYHGGHPSPKRYNPEFQYMFVLSLGQPTTFNGLVDRPTIYMGQTRRVGRGFRQADGKLQKSFQTQRAIPDYSLRGNIWNYANGGNGASAPDFADAQTHPATFPLALAKDHIRTWTNEGDLVIDPMAGSGTVSRAAKDLGRNSIAVEIHEPYVDLIRRRMSQEVLELA